jgi:hypothetical protein
MYRKLEDYCRHIIGASSQDDYYYKEWQSGIDHEDFSLELQSEQIIKHWNAGREWPEDKIKRALDVAQDFMKSNDRRFIDKAVLVLQEIINTLQG